MIRQTIIHALEGEHLHDTAVFLAERLLSERRNPAVKLWSPQSRDAFRDNSDYPGLPDIVFRQDGFTYVIEVESHPSKRIYDKKIHQFFRCGIRDVITIDLSKFKNKNNWKSLEAQLEEWLP
jgi:hypothetical protein